MNRLALAAVAVVLALAAQAGDRRVEVREGSRVHGVLSVAPAGDRLLLTYGGHEAALGQCADEERSKAASPSGISASVVERNCGATVDFATHVELRSGELRASVAIFAGRVPVALRWTGEVLGIAHAPVASDRVYRRTENAIGAQVKYTAIGAPVPPTEHVEFSCFNYGATGRAAGIPAELLLRAAGWSQQASGIYRPEWGTWDGPAPYGDDPQGSRKIKEGILYHEQRRTSGQR